MDERRMNKDDAVRSICTLCPKGCGVLVHVEGGIAHKVEGDPDNPLNRGRLCIKGLATLEYVYHPQRLRHPVMRSAGRGQGDWKKVSWDEALDGIAEAFNKIKTEIGAESVAFIRGASKAYIDVFIGRLANAFGSPNLAAMGQSCHVPRAMASALTCGYYCMPDIEHPPACLIVWGFNPKETFFCENDAILHAVHQGTKLIVVDPMKTNLAGEAVCWARLRPGTDLAVALGMIRIMIDEDLYDHAFVENWTVGFEELKSHVQPYTPEKVAEIAWLPQAVLKEMTRTYAQSKPACITWGNGIDHTLNSFQTARAITILRMISGNLGIPGGEILWAPLPLLGREAPPAGEMGQRVGFEQKILPTYKSAMPDKLIAAMLTDDPYPIRGAFVQGGDPVMTYNGSQMAHEGFKALDFLAVSDMFMTPTAALADVILPAASFIEHDSIIVPPQNIPIALAQRKAVEVGECWSAFKILAELAKRLGVSRQFGCETEQEIFDEILKPSGLTLQQFKEVGRITTKKLFGQYESKGFNTPSGKVELYSKRLKKWGYDPLPIYYELPETPFSEAASQEKYPFILTSWKPIAYCHSWGRQIPMLRASHPDPVIMMHPETASRLNIHEGDWVWIETRRGRIKQRAALDMDLDHRVILAEFGWWSPEKELSDPERWSDSNINVLTDDCTSYNRAMGSANEMGSPSLRGLFCNVHK